MRRILLSVVACCAVIAFVPASAPAQGHHHKRHHHRGHHARVRHFGDDQNQNNPGAGQNQDQTAGTVQSFSNGVLTIALNDGSMVSGTVTGDTEIECQAPDRSSVMQSHDRHGGDNGGGDNGDNNQGDDDNGQGDDNNEGAAQTCDMSSLTPGAVVQEAELKISSAGAVWDKVELVSASAADNDNDDD